MSQIIPDRPSYLSPDEWRYVLDRDRRACACINQCRREGKVGQSEYCSQQLHMDHDHPKALGGDDSFVNSRLLCESPNCGRGLVPSPRWTRRSFWDRTIVSGKLREVQFISGYGAVTGQGLSRVLTERRNDLRSCITLLPGATGIGKAIQAQSVFFGINEVVNAAGQNRPRVGQVLWLTIDQTLRDMAVRELRDDAFNLGIVTHGRPDVTSFESFDDFTKGPGDYDIVVACPHSLWKVKGSNGNDVRRTPDEIRAVLSWYDTIVFDECDWAVDRVREIATLASHALKFSLTASPPIIDGDGVTERFRNSFVLISGDAVADYKRALDLDGCLKFLDHREQFIRTSGHDAHDAMLGGVRQSVDNKAELGHAVFLTAIKQAVREMDTLESAMKKADPENYFSPHILARFDRVEDIIAINESLNSVLDSMELRNPGWHSTPLFENHSVRLKGKLSRDEFDLSRQDKNGKWVHPFMRGKNPSTKGRADESSKRICLIANIGIRGINNWPILAVVDCSLTASVGLIVQLSPGRALRLPPHLSHYIRKEDLRGFVTARLYLPESSIDDAAKRAAIRESREFIFDMQRQISSRGFRTWQDIIEGIGPGDIAEPDNGNTAVPFDETDRLRIQNELGASKVAGRDIHDPEEIARVVATLKPEASGTRRRRAEAYAARLRDNVTFCRNEVLAEADEDGFSKRPTAVITKLKPQESYDINTLSRFVREDSSFSDADISMLVRELENGHKATEVLVSRALYNQQIRDYQEPAGKIFRLHGNGADGQPKGVLAELSGRLYGDLVHSGSIKPGEAWGDVPKAVNYAAKLVFGVDSAEEGGPLDHHAYHVAIAGRSSRPIRALALAALVKWGVLRNMSALVS